jgi:hypothetical protein
VTIIVRTRPGRTLEPERATELLRRLRQQELTDAGVTFADALEEAIGGGGAIALEAAAKDVWDASDAWLSETDTATVGEAVIELRHDLASVLGYGENTPTGGTRFNPTHH